MTDSLTNNATGAGNQSEKGKKFKSSHKYTLEEFGLSEEWIQAECKEVIVGYDLEAD